MSQSYVCSRAVSLVSQWDAIERSLPDDWSEARLALRIVDEPDAARAAALLGPANPGRHGAVVRFRAARAGGPGPELIRRLLRKADEGSIWGTLELIEVEHETQRDEAAKPSLAEAWDDTIATVPSDWTDLVAELDLTSSDYLGRAALQMSPLNPTRSGPRPVLRFRVARRFGYGASPGMARRCLERLDAEQITGELRVLHVMSDSKPVATQGPVWYVGGRTV
jgi:hypothetical protein